jgi:hypothetical protein
VGVQWHLCAINLQVSAFMECFSLFYSVIRFDLQESLAANTKGRLLSRPLHRTWNENYFLGAMASLAALATRNFTTVLALIWMGSPV